jgi:hypothetical protein
MSFQSENTKNRAFPCKYAGETGIDCSGTGDAGTGQAEKYGMAAGRKRRLERE